MSGAAGSNACPAGSVRIETEAACRAAAASAGKTPSTSGFVETTSTYPRGCYYTSTSYAYFNTHAVGAGNSMQLLCAALVTTGAPPPMRAAALRVCAADARQRRCGGAVWARAVCVYAPSRSRALEGTARYLRAACMYEWIMYMYRYMYRYIYRYIDTYL